ncbi:hypothetical protein JCM16814_34790 [Desulfobaculum senezii]
MPPRRQCANKRKDKGITIGNAFNISGTLPPKGERCRPPLGCRKPKEDSTGGAFAYGNLAW